MLLEPQEFREWLCRNTSNNNEIITDQQDVGSAVAQSRFYRLPLELRLHILRLIFGGRILHLEVLCPHDAGYDTRTWWSCVCDRDVNWSMTQDLCRQVSRGRRISSRCHPTEIGVTGWLYSCRLGYVEASHVLYSTNTFRSASGRVVSNLDVLFPSNRLAQIPGLEIFCDFAIPVPKKPGTPMKKEAGIRRLDDCLSKIANSFHSLRSVHFGWEFIFKPKLSSHRRQLRLDIVDSCLDRVDEIICQRIHGVKVEIVIDQKAFSDLWNKSGDSAYCDYLHVGQKLWRKRKDRDTGILLSKKP